MKRTLILLLFPCYAVMAFSQAYEGTIHFEKKRQAALVIDYDYPAEAVQTAITQHIERLGFKPREEKGLLNRDKGFVVFRNALVPAINGERNDYIIKVDRKSRKESDASTLFLVMNRDKDNVLSRLNPEDLKRAKDFLNKFQPEIRAAYLEMQIREQEELVTRSEKKLKELKEEEASLEKKLEENKADQERAQKEIETQKQQLGKLQGQRKKAGQ